MRVRPFLIVTMLALVALGTFLIVACDSKDVRAVARGMEALGREGRAEFAQMQLDGDASPEDAAAVAPFFDEMERAGQSFAGRLTTWDTMTKRERRKVIVEEAAEVEQIMGRLESRGALKFKTEEARKKFDERRKYARRGLAVLRVVLETLPDEPAGA